MKEEKKQRDERGRFLEGNDISKEGGQPPIFNSVEEFDEAIEGYLDSCKGIGKNGEVIWIEQPLLTGLPVYVGCDKDTIIEYSKKDGYSASYKKLKTLCEHFAVKALYRTKGNPAGPIFNLKVNYGYQDKVALEHSGHLSALEISVVTDKQVTDDPDDHEEED